MSHSKKKGISNREMYDDVWFSKELSKRVNKTIEINEVGYESILLEHEEVDEEMIPLHLLKALPNPFLAHSYLYITDTGDEWLCVIITDESHQLKHYEAWFKNNKEVDEEDLM